MTHPPQETPQILTTHLHTVDNGVNRNWSIDLSSFFSQSSQATRFFAVPQSVSLSTLLGGGIAASIPVLFMIFAQPNAPELQQALAQPTQQYVASAAQPSSTAVAAATSAAQVNTTDSAPSQQAELASATSNNSPIQNLSETEKKYHYQLSLAQAYLKKAIRVSQATKSQTQTPEQKQEILTHLDASMQAANAAVDLIPDNGDAFFIRAQVYHISSFIQPELAELADQDKIIANALGISDEYLSQENSPIENPIDFLPTQQASEQPTAMIAEPEQNGTDTISTQTGDNTNEAVAVIPAGTQQLTIPISELTADMTISLSNQTNATPVQIIGRTNSTDSDTSEGSITVQLQNPADSDVTIAWSTQLL